VELAGTLRDRDAATIADEVAAAAVEHQYGTPGDDIAVVVVRHAGFHGQALADSQRAYPRVAPNSRPRP
jgi:hypothetical protein